MAGNPLTDPNWPIELADQVERLVGTVRTKATTPVVHGARAVVYGFLVGLLGIFAVTLLIIAAIRGLQALLDLFLTWERAVYVSYLLVGGILCIAGAFLLTKRRLPDV